MSRLFADIHLNKKEFSLDVLIDSDSRRIGVLGASGSGKSLTLRSIAGIEDVESGRILIDGKTLFDSGKKINLKPQKRNVGYMFQNYALFPTMCVLDNVTAGLKGGKEENRSKAHDMLSRFDMNEYADRLPGELSGGQQQRVALARIMVTEPDLILLDEPFSALDGHLRDRMQMEMMEILEDYPGQVVMVSHSRDELYRFSEELYVISGGRMLKSGNAKEVFRNPQIREVAALTGCKNIANIRVLNNKTFEISAWNVTLKLNGEIPEGTSCIGYRAHYFEPVWGEREENCIKFDLARVDDLPFEKNYYIRAENASPDSDNLICWFVQGDEQKLIDEKGLPDWLRLSEDAILFLK